MLREPSSGPVNVSRVTPGRRRTHRGAHAVQRVLVDGVPQPHLAVQRMLLVVAHKVHETLELCRAAQHEETALLLNATVFDLPLRPADKNNNNNNNKCLAKCFWWASWDNLMGEQRCNGSPYESA